MFSIQLVRSHTFFGINKGMGIRWHCTLLCYINYPTGNYKQTNCRLEWKEITTVDITEKTHGGRSFLIISLLPL